MTINWKAASRFTRPEDSTGYLLWQVTHAWQRQLEQTLAALDLTHLQFVLLAGIGWLTRNGDLLTQVELAAFCQIDVMQISQVVRKLEAKKLIRRTTHPTDTRAKVLALTPIGETKLQAVRCGLFCCLQSTCFTNPAPATTSAECHMIGME
jgi:DNA-binding MarR family transcriptional regulator